MRFAVTRISYIFILLIVVSCLPACGYHFSGHYSSLPPEIKTVSIPVFSNKTFEPGIESLFTNALIKEFFKSYKLKVVSGEGDSIITGEVTSFKLDPISYTRDDRVLEYRAIIHTSVTFKNTANGEVIWKNKNLFYNEEYLVSSDLESNEAAEQEAKEKIVQELAERIHASILEGM